MCPFKVYTRLFAHPLYIVHLLIWARAKAPQETNLWLRKHERREKPDKSEINLIKKDIAKSRESIKVLPRGGSTPPQTFALPLLFHIWIYHVDEWTLNYAGNSRISVDRNEEREEFFFDRLAGKFRDQGRVWKATCCTKAGMQGAGGDYLRPEVFSSLFHFDCVSSRVPQQHQWALEQGACHRGLIGVKRWYFLP